MWATGRRGDLPVGLFLQTSALYGPWAGIASGGVVRMSGSDMREHRQTRITRRSSGYARFVPIADHTRPKPCDSQGGDFICKRFTEEEFCRVTEFSYCAPSMRE